MIRTTLILVILVFAGCKETTTTKSNSKLAKEETIKADSLYHGALTEVLEAHGGLARWKKQRFLSYEMPKNTGAEKHSIALYSRKDLVETDMYTMGYDGENVWILDPEGVYKGDPVFYHNLMFYFYAMPFVLADDGIRYFDTAPLIYEGREYPGLGISYNDGVGTSPEDEYYIHFEPDTHKMAWLGYTVTYRTGKKSDDIHWIRYDDWTDIDGLLLPKSITWHEVVDGKLSGPGNTVNFEEIKLSKSPVDEDIFEKPQGAEIRLPVNPDSK